MPDLLPAKCRRASPRPLSAFLLGTAALLAVACGPPAAPPRAPTAEVEAERQRQYQQAAAHLLGHMERVSRVGARITVAGAPFCGEDTKPYIGILSASRSSVARKLGQHQAWKEAGAAMREVWQIEGGPEVLAVLPDSPASEVGIQVGDHIIDLKALTDTPGSPLWLEVSRHGKPIREKIPYVAECEYPVTATVGDMVNAHVSGETIIITTGLLRFVERDDELAVVIGHELAHRILGHRRSRRRSRERAADYIGVYLAARAGYDPAAAADFVRRLAAEHPELISERASPAHPGTPGRVAALDRAVAEIREKQRRGAPLFPETIEGLDPEKDAR